jgi:hypothetical protein
MGVCFYPSAADCPPAVSAREHVAVASPRLTELSLACEPGAWAAAGFLVEDGAMRLGGVRVRFEGEGGGIAGWALAAARERSIDGLPTREGRPPRGAPGEHPNGALGLDHVVVSTPDLGRTLRALERAGFDLRRTREAGDRRQAFYVIGDCLLEVVGPARPEGGGPARFWGLVAVVADLERAAALLGPALGGVRDAVQTGRRIATVREEAGLGVPVALITPRPRS